MVVFFAPLFHCNICRATFLLLNTWSENFDVWVVIRFVSFVFLHFSAGMTIGHIGSKRINFFSTSRSDLNTLNRDNGGLDKPKVKSWNGTLKKRKLGTEKSPTWKNRISLCLKSVISVDIAYWHRCCELLTYHWCCKYYFSFLVSVPQFCWLHSRLCVRWFMLSCTHGSGFQ